MHRLKVLQIADSYTWITTFHGIYRLGICCNIICQNNATLFRYKKSHESKSCSNSNDCLDGYISGCIHAKGKLQCRNKSNMMMMMFNVRNNGKIKRKMG